MNYKEILKGIVQIINTTEKSDIGFANICTYIGNNCPELAESEDELTWLTRFIKEEAYSLSMDIRDNEDRVKLKKLQRSLAWLEKQGDQKPADKVESKFHKGDWITHNIANFIFKIINVGSNGYEVVNRENYKKTISFNNEDNYHLWTIQDAKDGDVLAADECYVIFKEIDGLNIKCYCTYHYMGFNPIFHIDTLQNKTAFKPATKEQRDALMKAMTASGYEWDAEKERIKEA